MVALGIQGVTMAGTVAYRLYCFTDGHRLPAIVLNCANDEEAIRLAIQRANGRRAELWRGLVYVTSWPAKPQP